MGTGMPLTNTKSPNGHTVLPIGVDDFQFLQALQSTFVKGLAPAISD